MLELVNLDQDIRSDKMNPWDQRFQGDEYVFGTEPAKALVKLEQYLVPDGTTLVAADGEGRNSVYLASKGFKVTATDYSKIGVDKAKRLATERNVYVNYIVEDIFERDWPSEQYDNVVAVFIKWAHFRIIGCSGFRTAGHANNHEQETGDDTNVQAH